MQIITNRTCYIWSLYGWQWMHKTQPAPFQRRITVLLWECGWFILQWPNSHHLLSVHRFDMLSPTERRLLNSFVTHFLSPLRLGHYRSGPAHVPMRAHSLEVHFSYYFHISYTKGPTESARTVCSEGPYNPALP